MFFQLTINYPQLLREGETPLRLVEDGDFYLLRNTTQSIDIRLRKRRAYPGTYCHQIGEGSFRLGYGPVGATRQDQEYLHITIDAQGELTIMRDAYMTLPLFYGRVDDILVITNHYEAVLHALPRNTMSARAVRELLMATHHRLLQGSLTEEVHLLTERELLESNAQSLRVSQPADRPWRISQDAPPSDPQDFPRVFSERLSHFTQSRLNGQRFAYQASGGLDSSALPLFLAKKSGVSAPLATIWFPDSQRDTQATKLQALAQYLGGEPLLGVNFDEGQDALLGGMLATQQFRCFYPWESPFTSVFSRQAEQLQQQGIEVLCSGMGGDDIFENVTDIGKMFDYGPSGREQRQLAQLPPFFTESLKSAYIATTPEQPPHAIPLLPLTLMPAAITANTFIEHGIWLVSPFADPTLFEFCQGLPAHFRANKSILRIFYVASGFPEEIYNPQGDETIQDHFEEALRSPKTYDAIVRLAQNSRTAKLGYVDTTRLLETVRACQAGDSTALPWLDQVYPWICAEINLRTTPHLSE